LKTEVVHALELIRFLGTALLFWWAFFHTAAGRKMALGAGILYIFTMALQSGLLGALLSFAPQPWYPAQSAGAVAWGISALDDQQLAGALMWAPAGVVYLITAVWLLGSRLLEMERADEALSWKLEEKT